ncbi:hypothetical protein [Planktothrix agardhii]|nr:hypothetical protein [Planktothrix agardhii]
MARLYKGWRVSTRDGASLQGMARLYKGWRVSTRDGASLQGMKTFPK